MTITIAQLEKWLATPSENEHLEFKEAKTRFDFEKLVAYCVALANEGGGHMILGVSDKRPRKVVGTTFFANIERTKAGLLERLHLRVFVEEVQHPPLAGCWFLRYRLGQSVCLFSIKGLIGCGVVKTLSP